MFSASLLLFWTENSSRRTLSTLRNHFALFFHRFWKYRRETWRQTRSLSILQADKIHKSGLFLVLAHLKWKVFDILFVAGNRGCKGRCGSTLQNYFLSVRAPSLFPLYSDPQFEKWYFSCVSLRFLKIIKSRFHSQGLRSVREYRWNDFKSFFVPDISVCKRHSA